jgi:DNA-binding transcriptional MerR regulator
MTMQELSSRSGTPVRTIRFYISQRLLEGPHGRGTSSSYAQDHLRRLLLIRQLARRHVPLGEIRGQLEKLSPETLARVLALERRREAVEAGAQKGSPRQYLSALLQNARLQRADGELVKPYVPLKENSGVWRRVNVAEGIELHLTLESEERNKELVTALIDFAKQVAQKASGRKKT